jgi:glycosyltransferase involved in cell wall biosynthesis
MKIVNIIQRYSPAVGGSETWCQEVSRYLADAGHNVEVLTINVNKEEEFWREPFDNERTTAFGRLALDDGVVVRRYKRSLPIHTFHKLVYKSLLDERLKIYFYGPHSAEMYGKMWRYIKLADIVFLHTAPYPHNYFAFFYAKLFRKKIVFVPHFHPSHPHYERASNYWLLRHCDAVITVSDFEKEYLKAKGIADEKIYVTGNAIHPELYIPGDLAGFRAGLATRYGLKPEEKVITFIGRKTREKGVGYLIDAVKACAKETPLKLFLVGPSIDWYTELYAQLSCEHRKNIVDLGVLSHQDKVNLLHVSDLLVLPSRYEAFGIVFLEAWICGVPVLGTTEGAMPSVIGNEGYLCKFGDVDDLKVKIQEALADPVALKTKGMEGKNKVLGKYTWDVIGKKAENALMAAYER